MSRQESNELTKKQKFIHYNWNIIFEYIENSDIKQLENHLSSLEIKGSGLLGKILNRPMVFQKTDINTGEIQSRISYPLPQYCLEILDKKNINLKKYFTHRKIANLLIEYGADPKQKDSKGKDFEAIKKEHYIKPVANYLPFYICNMRDKKITPEMQTESITAIVRDIKGLDPTDLQKILSVTFSIKNSKEEVCTYPLSHYFLKLNDRPNIFSNQNEFDKYAKIASLLSTTYLGGPQTDYAGRSLGKYVEHIREKYQEIWEIGSETSESSPEVNRPEDEFTLPGGDVLDEDLPETTNSKRSSSAPAITKNAATSPRNNKTPKKSTEETPVPPPPERPSSRDSSNLTPSTFTPMKIPTGTTLTRPEPQKSPPKASPKEVEYKKELPREITLKEAQDKKQRIDSLFDTLIIHINHSISNSGHGYIEEAQECLNEINRFLKNTPEEDLKEALLSNVTIDGPDIYYPLPSYCIMHRPKTDESGTLPEYNKRIFAQGNKIAETLIRSIKKLKINPIFLEDYQKRNYDEYNFEMKSRLGIGHQPILPTAPTKSMPEPGDEAFLETEGGEAKSGRLTSLPINIPGRSRNSRLEPSPTQGSEDSSRRGSTTSATSSDPDLRTSFPTYKDEIKEWEEAAAETEEQLSTIAPSSSKTTPTKADGSPKPGRGPGATPTPKNEGDPPKLASDRQYSSRHTK